MNKEELECKNCMQPMKRIGGIGKDVQIMKWEGIKQVPIGIREAELYQCPICKNVEIY